MRIVLADTNLFLRFVDSQSDLHSIAVDAISRLAEVKDKVVLTTQNLVEFWAVATRPRENNGLGWTIAQTAEAIARIRDLFDPVPEAPELVEVWFQLVQELQVRGKRTHDARLVAVMKLNGIQHLLTFNVDDFRNFPEILVLDPRKIAGNSHLSDEKDVSIEPQ